MSSAEPAITGRRSLILAACMTATFMTAVENTIVGTAMPTIVASLGDFHLFSWVFAVYLLFQAVSIPIYGRLSDLYGRKRVFFAGATIFLAGSTLCGFAQDMFMLIAFRALQGMGAGALQPLAYAIVGDIYTPAERAKVQGLLSSVFGVAAIVGPTLGAFLVEHASWSVVFWVNLPVGAVAMIMLGTFLRERPHEKAARIDYLASLLLMLGGGALMMAMIQAGRLGGWELAALIVIGVGALAALVRHERHVPAPILPIRFWSNRIIALGNFGSFSIGMVMMSVTGFLPIYVQAVMGRDPTVTGIVLGSMSVSWAVASILSGRLMIRTNYRTSAMLGGAMLALGSVVLVTMTASSGPAWAAAGAFCVGIGMGCCNTTYLVSVQGAAALRERGAATASNMFMRIVGQASGAALFGALVNAVVVQHAPEPAALASALRNVHIVGAAVGLAVFWLGTRLPAALSPITGADKYPAVSR
jgi:EmrB/QacA subfamily drug resistance transporter